MSNFLKDKLATFWSVTQKYNLYDLYNKGCTTDLRQFKLRHFLSQSPLTLSDSRRGPSSGVSSPRADIRSRLARARIGSIGILKDFLFIIFYFILGPLVSWDKSGHSENMSSANTFINIAKIAAESWENIFLFVVCQKNTLFEIYPVRKNYAKLFCLG